MSFIWRMLAFGRPDKQTVAVSVPEVRIEEAKPKKKRYTVVPFFETSIRIEEDVYLRFSIAVENAMEDCGLTKKEGEEIMRCVIESALFPNKGNYYAFQEVVKRIRKIAKENESKFPGKEEAISDFLIWAIIVNGGWGEFVDSL